jgi:spermidine/putrescine transport system permease protein
VRVTDAISLSSMRRVLERWASALLIGTFIAFLFAPLLIVVVFSFNASPGLSLPITGLSLRWYEKALQDPAVVAALGRSAAAAIATGIVACILGIATAFGLRYAKGKTRAAVQSGMLLVIATPGLLLAIGLAIYFNRLGLRPQRLPMTIVGHVLISFPIVVLILMAALERFPFSLLEAARDLGASPGRAFMTITLPLLFPAVLGASLVAAAVSFDEFIIAFFTSGNDQTLPLVIYTRVRRSIDPSLNALATLLLLGTTILALSAARTTAVRR